MGDLRAQIGEHLFDDVVTEQTRTTWTRRDLMHQRGILRDSRGETPAWSAALAAAEAATDACGESAHHPNDPPEAPRPQVSPESAASEARSNLVALYEAAWSYWNDQPEGHSAAKEFPAPSAGPTPPLGTCCASGGRCNPSSPQWRVEPWWLLHFSMDAPHHYSYEYRVTQTGFTALAYGDLDCDGEYSTFSVSGDVNQPPPDDGYAKHARVRVVKELE
jgi:hypothetical protein